MSESINRNRRVLLLIAGIPLLIILGASALWYLVASGRLDLVAMLGTANQGEFLDRPMDVRELGLEDVEGRAFDPVEPGKPVWRILIPGGPDCDEACRQLVYYTRQIHTAMGKYQNRINRVLAVSGEPDESLSSELRAEYPELKVLYTSAAGLEGLASAAAAAGAPAPGYYLVDPQGWIILAYEADADGKDIMADLKFLLKNSSG